MECSASESKPFQGRFKVETPGRARREERQNCSKSHIIGLGNRSDAEHNLAIQTRVLLLSDHQELDTLS